MNKAITDGVLLMPPAFEGGLGVWSSSDGTPGSDTYASAGNAAFVPADPDFGGCLELFKNQSRQRLRYMGETPLLPGCYLQIKARIKVLSGNLPSVQIAGWAGGAGGAHVPGVVEVGPSTTITSYGNVVEVTAIVGAGDRGGVDMVWGREALYGHFGLDLTGPIGGVVRIDDLEITDITSVFLRDMLSRVDVRDYGALGDGSTNDSGAFEAADAAAEGREILVPAGTYYLGDSVTLDSRVRFEGTVTMPRDKMLLLTKNFDLPAYIDAFGDEELAFKKAFQALLNNADHESLDMGGRNITVTSPIDMQNAVPNKGSYVTRRVIRNGQLVCNGSTEWTTEEVTSQATYDPGASRTLSNVTNVANVPVGSLVEGNGVGREIYVRSRNIATQELTLTAPLFDAAGTQNYRFKRFKYLLDFSGFSKLSRFSLRDVELLCDGKCSGVMLAPQGITFNMRDCFVSYPADRGVTSIGTGCQGILIDRCQFISNEGNLEATQRGSIALNVNANDAKIRNNRATRFRHFAMLAGSNNVVTGNHFFQGDGISNGVRTAGLVMADNNPNSTINANYVDNCFIEWTNERDPSPAFSTGYSFTALSITENVFLSGAVAPWFSYIVVKPHGAGHFLNGVTITGNKFNSTNGSIDRVERVDTSYANLDFSRSSDVVFDNNSFHAVSNPVSSPLRMRHRQNSTSATWVVETAGQLPFNSWARSVDSITTDGPIRTAGGGGNFAQPYTLKALGPLRNQIAVVWNEATRGTIDLVVRMDR